MRGIALCDDQDETLIPLENNLGRMEISYKKR
jgi:hypothetical protein